MHGYMKIKKNGAEGKDVQGRLSTGLGRPFWIYIIPTHDMHQWLLLQILVLLMMGAERVRNM
jgi:hypothetical protein